MIKVNRDKLKGFVIGSCVSLILVSGVVPAVASSIRRVEDIRVAYSGIKMYVDGKLTIPTDSKGNVVEPFIYDGTTYLPARALSNALTNNQKEVTWNPDTQSIYIGKAPVAAQTDISEIKPYAENGTVYKGERANFRILDKTITPFNRFDYGAYYTYILNSNYNKIKGEYVIPYTLLGSRDKGILDFYSVDRKGVETLIKSYTIETGDDSIQIDVDLLGVEILKIRPKYGAFYNVTLEGVK